MPECNFYVGQKVVCIRDLSYCAHLPNANPAGLRKGSIYTVRWLGTHANTEYPDEICVRLVEIHRPLLPQDEEEIGFSHRLFRPATDISALEALLKSDPAPVKQKAPEDA